MKTGAAKGPPATVITQPIGVAQTAGSPQWRITWIAIMKRTAAPRARSKPAIRSSAGPSPAPRGDGLPFPPLTGPRDPGARSGSSPGR